MFESVDESTFCIIINQNIGANNKIDSRVFWVTSYLAPISWLLIAVLNLMSLSFTNMTICFFGVIMSSINLQAYIKCEKSHNKKVSGFLIDQAKSKLSFEQMAKIGTFASKYAGSFASSSK